MKFKEFADPALNLGFMDVRLASGVGLGLVSCSTCNFSTSEMFYCDCDHVFCRDCLLLLEDPDCKSKSKVQLVHCIVCSENSSSTKIVIDEAFFAQLQCVCPQCKITVRLDELKAHLKCCVSTKRGLQTSIRKSGVGLKKNVGEESGSSEPKVTLSGESAPAKGDLPVEVIVGTVRRELIDRSERDQRKLAEELNSSFEAKIQNLANQIGSMQTDLDATQVKSRPRTFRLTFDSEDRATNTLYTSAVVFKDVTVHFRGFTSANADKWKTVETFIDTVSQNVQLQGKVHVTGNTKITKELADVPKNEDGSLKLGLALTFPEAFAKYAALGTAINVEFE